MESATIHLVAQALAKLGLNQNDVEKLRLAAEASDKDVSSRGQDAAGSEPAVYISPPSSRLSG